MGNRFLKTTMTTDHRVAYVRPCWLTVLLYLALGLPESLAFQQQPITDRLRTLNPNVLTEATRQDQAQKLASSIRLRITAANRRSSEDWGQISNRAQWEQFAKQKIQLLESSLGTFPPLSKDMAVHVTQTLPGEGFTIENLVFESRPGLWVTANLYSPQPLRARMPGILLCHSHHNPKTQGELQDMGMTWARQGYLVLVTDQLGHGERRQHPFGSAADYAGSFEVNRQDYYFRYNLGIQLQLIGDSLMGWMVWDLRRGVDLLLSRTGIDPANIILMGSVAGGGDPAGVTAALDARITAAVPFNFGGPQPEDPFPLLANPEESFNFAGNGSWESTRNLTLSCQDGFLPWVIVGAIAPRRLIYAHEFSWDQANDPVWKRLRKIYDEFYQAPDRVDYTQGYGVLKGRPPQASHCNNIGPPHRERIHAALSRWCQVPVNSKDEYSNRRTPEELTALTTEATRKIQPRPALDIAAELGQERATAAWAQLEKLDSAQRVRWLRNKWQSLLGNIVPDGKPRLVSIGQTNEPGSSLRSERVLLETEPDVVVPLLILNDRRSKKPKPVVIGLAQEGKAGFLKHRAELIAELLKGDVAICLPDVRGTGETRLGLARGRTSEDTSLSSSELMLGKTILGARLRDLRGVVHYLRTRRDLDARRLAVWGDSFASPNAPEQDLKLPYGIREEAATSEPLGSLLALLLGLYEEDVRAVFARGGLVGFQSALSSPFLYLPHDVVIPGIVTAGDLSALAAGLAPRPLALVGLVDGLNRAVEPNGVEAAYAHTRQAYEAARVRDRFVVGKVEAAPAPGLWLLETLNGK
jgi:dienelactone hydrolase